MPDEGEITIRRAALADLDIVVPLFDAYRQFYRFAADLDGAKEFLRARFENDQSVIFLAFRGDAAVGFTQLYPGFSSGSMRRIFVLNDLYVSEPARCSGIGRLLLRTAEQYERSAGAVRLTLSTELSNHTAQSLYEKSGWVRDTIFCAYNLTL